MLADLWRIGGSVVRVAAERDAAVRKPRCRTLCVTKFSVSSFPCSLADRELLADPLLADPLCVVAALVEAKPDTDAPSQRSIASKTAGRAQQGSFHRSSSRTLQD